MIYKVSYRREDGCERFQIFETLKSAQFWADKKRALGYQPEIKPFTAENTTSRWCRVAR